MRHFWQLVGILCILLLALCLVAPAGHSQVAAVVPDIFLFIIVLISASIADQSELPSLTGSRVGVSLRAPPED